MNTNVLSCLQDAWETHHNFLISAAYRLVGREREGMRVAITYVVPAVKYHGIVTISKDDKIWGLWLISPLSPNSQTMSHTHLLHDCSNNRLKILVKEIIHFHKRCDIFNNKPFFNVFHSCHRLSGLPTLPSAMMTSKIAPGDCLCFRENCLGQNSLPERYDSNYSQLWKHGGRNC